MTRDHSTTQAKAFNDAWTAIGTVLFVDAQPTEGLDVTDGQLLVLYTLEALGSMRVGQLAEATGMLGPGLSRTLTAMERRELVMRTPDPEDGRASLVGFAPQGRAIVQQHQGKLVATVAKLLDSLPVDDRAEVVQCAERIRELLAPPRR